MFKHIYNVNKNTCTLCPKIFTLHLVSSPLHYSTKSWVSAWQVCTVPSDLSFHFLQFILNIHVQQSYIFHLYELTYYHKEFPILSILLPNITYMFAWLIDCELCFFPLENSKLIQERHHCRRMAPNLTLL